MLQTKSIYATGFNVEIKLYDIGICMACFEEEVHSKDTVFLGKS